jgi:hypothetical protein
VTSAWNSASSAAGALGALATLLLLLAVEVDGAGGASDGAALIRARLVDSAFARALAEARTSCPEF